MDDDLNQALSTLCRRTGAVGAVLCDDEGETVTASLGPAPLSPEAEALAREHIPKAMELQMPIGEFVLRLAGAESCAVLRGVQGACTRRVGGRLDHLHLRYSELDVLIEPLPEDFYLVLMLRRPLLLPMVRLHLDDAVSAVSGQLD